MNVWKPAGVADEPNINISDWRVYEVADKKTRHLVGWEEGGRGRVSSAIQEYSPNENAFITRSGRKYTLIGASGPNADAAYTWQCWLNINNEIHYEDVSKDYE